MRRGRQPGAVAVSLIDVIEPEVFLRPLMFVESLAAQIRRAQGRNRGPHEPAATLSPSTESIQRTAGARMKSRSTAAAVLAISSRSHVEGCASRWTGAKSCVTSKSPPIRSLTWPASRWRRLHGADRRVPVIDLRSDRCRPQLWGHLSTNLEERDVQPLPQRTRRVACALLDPGG